MYDTILHVANDIITIGGALIIVLGVILMIALLVVVMRINRVIAKATDLVGVVSQYIMLPFTYLAGLFARGDEPENTGTSTRKRTTKSKK